jgi:envelope transporter Tic110
MNGFEIAELSQPGVFARLLGRKSKQDAYLEIQNLLAITPIGDLPLDAISKILSRYRIRPAEAASALRDIYATVLRHFLPDVELSEAEVADLRRLRDLFGLTDQDILQIEEQIVHKRYRKSIRIALSDSQLSPKEKQTLETVAKQLRLPDSVAEEIRSASFKVLVQRAYDAALCDHRLSPAEEKELQALSENLGTTVSLDTASQAVLAHYRLLWRLEEGELPELTVAINLKRGEICHGMVAASHHEFRTTTKGVGYAGVTGRIRIMRGVYYRVGQLNVGRVTEEVLKLLDTGTLYLTSTRLLFDGSTKSATIARTKIIGFIIFSDGIQIEKDSGKDQFFQCAFADSQDSERWGAMVQSALKKARV